MICRIVLVQENNESCICCINVECRAQTIIIAYQINACEFQARFFISQYFFQRRTCVR
jgi:hypothetical protein